MAGSIKDEYLYILLQLLCKFLVEIAYCQKRTVVE